MKKIVLVLALVAFMGSVSAPATAYAGCSYNGWFHSGGKCGKSWEKKEKSYKYERDDDDEDDDRYERRPYRRYIASEEDLQDYIDYLLELIEELKDRRDRLNDNTDEEPVATTQSAINIENDEAELRGSVDMNDFKNGRVFFVYGEDENQVDDARDEDRYSDIDEDSKDLQKVMVDNDLDNSDSYEERVTGLDDNTDHYFAICVEYEDEDSDDQLECGTVRTFETD